MGSSLTCKLENCCGDRLNCYPPVQRNGDYWDGERWRMLPIVKEEIRGKTQRT